MDSTEQQPRQSSITEPWQVAQSARTLIEAHNALVALQPADGADVGKWLTYHQRSAAVYDHVADVDRGHHHEALYWAARERRKADVIARTGAVASVDGETGRS